MKLTVLLFAALRDAADSESIDIELPEKAAASDVIAAVAAALPEVADLLPSCRLAIDSSYAANSDPVSDTNELALIPPVSGG